MQTSTPFFNVLPESFPIVSCQWLAENLNNAQLVIADCRFDLKQPDSGAQHYATAHIPGAVYFHLDHDLSSPVQQHGGRHPLPDLSQLAAKLSTIGITRNETLVVAYDDSRFAFAARLWWLLRYLGHDRVALLDGGFKTWQNLGHPTTSEIPTSKIPTSGINPGTFRPEVRPELLVDIEAVKTRKDQPGVLLIDSREPERYRGEYEPIDPVAGHIPGALNAFWKDVTDIQGRAKPIDWHQTYWANLGHEPDQKLANAREIIVYCGSGVTACVNLLSLELAGIPGGKLYAGSWSDWCSYEQIV